MNRHLVACVSALLVIVQVVVVPIAWAVTNGMACAECDHAGAVSAAHTDHDCNGHHPADDSAGRGPQHSHSRAAGHCHCVHVGTHAQATAMTIAAFPLPVPPAALSGEPKGPSFSAPLFELLRPPK